MPELALDDVDRHSFARELDRMRAPARTAAAYSVHRQLAQFGSGGGRGPSAPSRGPVNHAEQGSGRQQHAMRQPRDELLEPEQIHPGLATLVTLAMPNQKRPAPLVDIGLVERQGLRNPQPAPPQHSDQCTHP